MSELGVNGPVDDIAEPRGVAGLTAGSMLRSAREAAGLHVAALAVAMKIPVKKLEALESDRLDLLHDAVFVRALAASVCRTLKIDSAPVLAKLPSNTLPRLNSDERGINAPFHPAGVKNGFSPSAVLNKPQALIIFFLLAGVVAVFFLPDRKASEPAIAQSQQSQLVVNASEPVSVELPLASPSAGVAIPSASPTASVGESDSKETIASQKSQSGVSGPLPVETNATPAKSGLPIPGTIVFRAKAASWVKVVDSEGVVRLSKTLVDGEVASASGPAPLSIVIGRADVVDVEVRGAPFSLGSVAKENVARFEVK
jgi:cytoskeleton protein RodZ